MYYTVFFFLSSPLFFLTLSLSLSLSIIKSRHQTSLFNTLFFSWKKKKKKKKNQLQSRADPSAIPLLSPSLSLLSSPRRNNPKSSNRTNVKSGVSALSSTSTAFGTAASNQRLEGTGNGHIDDAVRQQALAEEEAVLNQYKVVYYWGSVPSYLTLLRIVLS